MRFLPLVLIAFMVAPMAIWGIVSAALPGNHSAFPADQATAMYTLLPLVAVAFGLLAWWSMRFICRTKGC